MAQAAYNSQTQYSRKYEDLRGVDLTSGQTQISPQRFAWAQNMWRDYSTEQGGAIETIPGFRLIAAWSGKKIYGVWQFRPFGGELFIMVHAGDTLYRFRHADRDAIGEDDSLIDEYTGLVDGQSTAFVFNGRFYILDGASFRVFMKDEEGRWELKDTADTAYLPVTYVNGEMYEQRNMLSNRTINRETEAAEYDYLLNYKHDPNGRGITITGFEDGYYTDHVIILGRVDDDSTLAKSDIRGFSSKAGIRSATLGLLQKHSVSDVVAFDGTVTGFNNCPDLERVDIVAKDIDGFHDCPKLAEVSIDSSLLISNGCFENCTALKTVRLGEIMGSLPKRCFMGCDNIEEIYLGKVTSFTLPYEDYDDEGELQQYSSFGSLNSIKRVYTAYTAEEIEGMATSPGATSFRSRLDNFQTKYGVEIVYETPAGNRLTAVKDEEGKYVPSLIARQAVIYDPADSVEQVHLDDDVMDTSDYGVMYHTLKGEDYVDKVVLLEERDADVKLTDMFIDVELNCKPGKFTTAEGYLDFASANEEYEGTAHDAIIKCTKSATFDGRVFLTGNPALPNTVFYCMRDDTGHPNPAYWGVLNYMNDGVGVSPNTAMLATADMLMVLKGNDPHDATIYYHAGVDTGNDVIPRIYPSERGLAGVGCLGIAVNFRDDAVFMSRAGLEAVGKRQVNLERTLAHRSTLVDRMLTREDIASSCAVEWGGYLMIFTPSGNVYLADSRQMWQNGENVEYEWYVLCDVGVYEGQTEDFIQITGDGMLYDDAGGHWLSEELTEAYAVIDGKRYPLGALPSEPQFAASGDVHMSYIYKNASGSEVWYIDPQLTEQARLPVARIGEYAYIVTESGRHSGGEFKSVTAAVEADEVLYFGTENGALCCFNTDKRGLSYNDEPVGVGAIHPHWYTFNERQIDSALVTAYDGAGFPDLAKKTVKKSLIVHAKTFPGSRIEVRVRTDRNDEWRTARDNYEARWTRAGIASTATYDFYTLDYASAPLQVGDAALTTIREKEKKWAYKQLYFGSLGFRSPWGLYRAGYRFTVTGRIKT